MRILVAEDTSTTQCLLVQSLTKWGYEVVSSVDGQEAWNVLQSANPPSIAILDWMMPKLDGIDICRLARQKFTVPLYIILLTGRGKTEDIVAGLNAGADDYIIKPFEMEELRARVKTGERFVSLQNSLRDHIRRLDESQHLLRKREQHYRTLVEGAPYSIGLLDATGRILSLNTNGLQAMNRQAKDILGNSFIDLWIRETQPAVSYAIAHALSGEHSSFIADQLLPNDLVATWEVALNPLFDDQTGKVTGLVVIGSDITQRKKTEDALRESERWFQTIGDAAMDGIMAINSVGKIIYCNRAGEQILGCATYEPVGQEFASFFPDGAGRDAMYRQLNEMQRNANIEMEPYVIESSLLSKKGQIVPVEVAMSIAKMHGEPHLISIIRDITERRIKDEQNQQLMTRLASANTELRDFAFVVSHDLKAPLRAISSLATWISQDYADKLDEDGKDQLELLVQRVGRMGKLIDGILEYSRIGRVTEKFAKIDLQQTLSDIVDILTPPEHITVTIQPNMPVLMAEPTRIGQLFQNLLSNAIKYNDKPQGLITVTCEDKGDSWQFEITDNGPGIPEKDYERVFQIFQTVKPRDEVDSTGVGLTVVKKIINTLQGKIWIDSKLGEYTTFSFILPKKISSY